MEQPCPPGRGITPVERKPTLWHVENRGKHHFSLWLAPPPPPDPLLSQRANRVISKQISHLLPDYGFSTLSCYVWCRSCQPFDHWRRSFVFAQFDVSVPRAPSFRSRQGIKTNSLLSTMIQMGSSLAEIVQGKNNHSTQLDLLQTYWKCFQPAVWLKRWVLFKVAQQKPSTPRFVYSNFPSSTHR